MAAGTYYGICWPFFHLSPTALRFSFPPLFFLDFFVGQAVSENAEKWQNTIDESKLLALAPQKSSEH